MLATLARGAYMLIVAAMIVAWAILPGKTSPAEPQAEQAVTMWWC